MPRVQEIEDAVGERNAPGVGAPAHGPA
jgi:hypothetical protein